MIRGIIEQTGVKIDVQDDGTVPSPASMKRSEEGTGIIEALQPKPKEDAPIGKVQRSPNMAHS